MHKKKNKIFEIDFKKSAKNTIQKYYMLPQTPINEILSKEQLANWQVDRCSYPTIPTRISRQNLETIDNYEGEF
jgi:hypothetical protein